MELTEEEKATRDQIAWDIYRLGDYKELLETAGVAGTGDMDKALASEYVINWHDQQDLDEGGPNYLGTHIAHTIGDTCREANKVIGRARLREALSALEHEQWAHWTEHMLKVLTPFFSTIRGPEYFENIEGAREALQRWVRQMDTPFSDLTEEEKDSDREWADKVLALVERAKGDV